MHKNLNYFWVRRKKMRHVMLFEVVIRKTTRSVLYKHPKLRTFHISKISKRFMDICYISWHRYSVPMAFSVYLPYQYQIKILSD